MGVAPARMLGELAHDRNITSKLILTYRSVPALAPSLGATSSHAFVIGSSALRSRAIRNCLSDLQLDSVQGMVNITVSVLWEECYSAFRCIEMIVLAAVPSTGIPVSSVTGCLEATCEGEDNNIGLLGDSHHVLRTVEIRLQ